MGQRRAAGGYFPFYVGSSSHRIGANLYAAIAKGDRKAFVLWDQLRMILVVMLPCVAYVALVGNPWFHLGIYVASALFIAFFMRYLGKYGWAKVVAVSLGTMVVSSSMFEIWFKVRCPRAARSGLRVRVAKARHARDPFAAGRLRRRDVVVQPDADVRRASCWA
jgi:hypothetical protein